MLLDLVDCSSSADAQHNADPIYYADHPSTVEEVKPRYAPTRPSIRDRKKDAPTSGKRPIPVYIAVSDVDV